MSFKEYDNESLNYFALVLSYLSAVGCFINILGFILSKSLRILTYELIFYMSIASFINYITFNFKNRNEIVCQLQGFLIIWFEHSSAIWGLLIAYNIHHKVMNVDNEEQSITLKKRLCYMFIGYLIPLILPIIALNLEIIGTSKYYCFISPEKKNKISAISTLVISYSIMWTLFFFSFYFIMKVYRILNGMLINKEEKELIIRVTSRLNLFPIVQIICLLPSTINRFLEIFDLNSIYFDYFVVILINSMGILYGIIYCLNPNVRDKIRLVFKISCCLKKKYKQALIRFSNETIENESFEKGIFQTN